MAGRTHREFGRGRGKLFYSSLCQAEGQKKKKKKTSVVSLSGAYIFPMEFLAGGVFKISQVAMYLRGIVSF